MQGRRRYPPAMVVAITLASLVAATLAAAPAAAADPIDVVFSATGTERSWVAPSGVTSIHVVLIGGRGGGNVGSAGAADIVSGDLTVAPGDTLYVEVGGNGGSAGSASGAAGGFNGGAAGGGGTSAGGSGGGGASDVRTIPRDNAGSLESRLVVAGGGGGRGGGANGAGGGTAGWIGGTVNTGDGTFAGGTNGTILAGGVGGGYLGTSTFAGANGTFGAGGAGGTDTTYGGGGGGGGYYGGGGGSGVSTFENGGAGGGGGASYRGAAQRSSIILDINNSQPSITITYTPYEAPTDPPPDQQEVVFAYTGAEQSFVVPAGVTSVAVVALGGRGGAGVTGGSGGLGARVSGVIEVTPGATLYVEVGGNGADGSGTGGAGGFNGGGPGGNGQPLSGGGGGGASDIRTMTRTAPGSLDSRLVVAAGGGGGGGANLSGGGTGGNAGSAGSDALSGADGGGAGTATAGGSGGAEPGGLGVGGGGGGTGSDSAGGGGGAGLYGGGGGAAAGGSSAGGGGGSSFTGTATGTSVTVGNHAVASITITYDGTPPGPTTGPDSGVVDATISMAESTVCIELSTASVDFGTGQFGQVGVSGSPDIVVTNCGATMQALLAHGTDATAPGAAWDLVNNSASCLDTLGLDAYHLRLLDTVTQDDEWGLGTTNTLLQSIDVGSSTTFGPRIDTACPGSSGAGLQMSMQIVFTATEAVP